MALKNLFDMVKADRYTADGREAIIKAQEAETEDQTYNIGDISRKTGLMKTATGWVKPPKGKQPGAKNAETNYGKVEKKDGKWGVQQKLGKGSQFIEHKDKKDATEALKNYTAGYNTTERSKQDPHSDQARQVKHWDKETEKIRKQNRAEGRAAHAAQFQSLQKTPGAQRGTKEFDKNEYIDSMKNSKNAPVSRMAREIQRETFDDEIKNTSGDKAKIEALTKQLLSPATESGAKITAEAQERAKNLVESRYRQLTVAESKPAATRREAVSAGRMMKDLDGNFWSRPEDFKEDITSRGWDVDEMTNEYAVISNEAGSQYEVRFDDHSDDGDLTVRTFKALQIDEDDDDDSLEDSAPRVLTGDTRIRVRKA